MKAVLLKQRRDIKMYPEASPKSRGLLRLCVEIFLGHWPNHLEESGFPVSYKEESRICLMDYE